MFFKELSRSFLSKLSNTHHIYVLLGNQYIQERSKVPIVVLSNLCWCFVEACVQGSGHLCLMLVKSLE